MLACNIKVLCTWYFTHVEKHPVPERYYTEDNCPSSAQHPLYGRPLVHLVPYSEMSLVSLALNATYVLHAIPANPIW